MNWNTRFNVRAIISNGTELSMHTNSAIALEAWKEGVVKTASLFSESVQFKLYENKPSEIVQFLTTETV
jgi:hypothetical protein